MCCLQISYELRLQLEDWRERDERGGEESAELQLHLHQQEQLITELEQREQLYSEQLHLLTMGIR